MYQFFKEYPGNHRDQLNEGLFTNTIIDKQKDK